MNYDQDNGRSSNMTTVRAFWHLGMGCVLLFIGGTVLTSGYFGNRMIDPPALAYTVGALFVVYGAFRIWRGIADLREMKQQQRQRRK